MKVAVLGGSSPFTLALIHALVESPEPISVSELSLLGRNEVALGRVAEYARHHMGCRVEAGTNLEVALRGADAVIQQVRFEGMAGREADEGLAQELGLPSDETLGPAALRRALRSAAPLRELADAIRRHAADAWVLNLTNPLSVSTALLHDRGVARCIGVCELPTTTARKAAAQLGVELGLAEWECRGLNHRSFISRLECDGEDLLERLIREPNALAAVSDTPLEQVRELGALPTKYFRLLRGEAYETPGRARKLEGLRGHILAELERAPTDRPTSLGLRVTDWYEEAVVPLLAAIASDTERHLVVNCMADDGLVRESLGWVHTGGVRTPTLPPPRPALAEWLDRFEAHERAVLEVVRRPDRERLELAIALDPLIPRERRTAALSALEPELNS